MEYSYKPTTHGRSVMAAHMALGTKPFNITRVAFGSGKVDEEVNLTDIHELLEFVSDGTVADRLHRDERLFLTIQYANSEHKDVPTFLLSEFIVYVEDPETGNETDLIYGTLGDYRQPVPAYNPAYPPSVFNFPLELILSDEIQVDISAPAGLVTFDELEALVNRKVNDSAESGGLVSADRMEQSIEQHNADPEAHAELVRQLRELAGGAAAAAGGAVIREVLIPTAAWTEMPEPDGKYIYKADVEVDGALAGHFPVTSLDADSQEIAVSAGMCPAADALDGFLRFESKLKPSGDITCTTALIKQSGGSAGGGAYVLPAATVETLGGVKIGNGLSVTPDGTISVDSDKVMTDEDLVDENEIAQTVANILNGDEAK